MAWKAYGSVRRSQSAVLNGSGAATLTFDTQTANQRWTITSIVVTSSQSSTTAPFPTATVYVGGQQQGTSEGGTWTGNQDTFTGSFVMTSSDTLTVEFTGGPTSGGITVTATIEGDGELWT